MTPHPYTLGHTKPANIHLLSSHGYITYTCTYIRIYPISSYLLQYMPQPLVDTHHTWPSEDTPLLFHLWILFHQWSSVDIHPLLVTYGYSSASD